MKLSKFDKIQITGVASYYCYCDRAVWIKNRLKIKEKPTLKMFRGTLMHALIECAEKNVHKWAKEGNNGMLLSEFIKNKLYEYIVTNEPSDANEFSQTEIEIMLCDLLDILKFKYMPRLISCMSNNYFSLDNVNSVRELLVEYEYRGIMIRSKLDYREEFEEGHIVIIDYKDSKPILNEYMKIQLDGYAFLMKMALGLETDTTIIEFPLFGVQKYHKPRNFLNYLDNVIDDLGEDYPPCFFRKINCKWCSNVVKKKCEELKNVS